MKHYYVTIAGNIGVGKTTLTRLLSKKMGWQSIYEAFSDNPYLKDFYDDMKTWGFHSQLYFLSQRIIQQSELNSINVSILQDRSIYEDAEVFAKNLFREGSMSERDWTTYQNLYQSIANVLTPPDLVIYLQASTPNLMKRIKLRGREFEKSISEEYIGRLNNLYEEWIDNFQLAPVLSIDTDNFDYVTTDEHLNQIIKTIQDKLYGKEMLSFE